MAQATYFGIFSEATLTRRQIMFNVLYFTPYGYPLEGAKPLTSDALRSINRNVEKYPMMSRTQVGQFCAKGGNDNDDGARGRRGGHRPRAQQMPCSTWTTKPNDEFHSKRPEPQPAFVSSGQ
ncbi:predicted protein [Histoplasma capsulatum G186AR]|uniref:Uncharacterized protein n=1 Tax=Ajellomyces capsulatus (strain G186AR / H82 / ATCC MYA-2454 / RMSCC 2432) TaxID=447093 RepID=C0NDR9_AJECG|nr:uncharacterized protein HCBG_02012 [Histoplasma capsulatum G186AR]EEH10367.1 predicted protein [Histoplasma capsulatum G186AR]